MKSKYLIRKKKLEFLKIGLGMFLKKKVNINKIYINTHKNKSTKLASAMEKEFIWH